jgi:hypothetical protein
MKKTLILFLFFQLSFFAAMAQEGGNRQISQVIYSNQYSTTIDPAIILSSNSTFTLPSFANTTDLENGLETSAINLMVQSNVNWKLTTEIGVITFSPTPESPAIITSPLTFENFTFATTVGNDLSFGSFTPFNINFQAVTKTGGLGDENVAGNRFNIKLKITPGYEVDPAIYTVPVIMTLSNQ